MLIHRLKSLPTWLKAVLGVSIGAFIAFVVGGTQTMPLDKSWTPSIILFVLAGITLVVIVGVIIYWLKTKDRTEHESKNVVENKARIPKPSRKQNCDKLAGIDLSPENSNTAI
jgi:formate-dependent nitrite reductase membrane component NrfD